MLVVLGTDFVQRGTLSAAPLVAGLPFALLVAAILYINQFPDRAADASAKKRTLVVRLGASKARWGYLLITLAAYLWLACVILVGALPLIAVISLLPAVLSLIACQRLWHHADQPAQLGSAIKATIAAANLQGILMVVALIASTSPKLLSHF